MITRICPQTIKQHYCVKKLTLISDKKSSKSYLLLVSDEIWTPEFVK